MLHSYNDLKLYSLRALDGPTGRVDDLYFDDSSWKIRYLVARSGFLFTSRQTLISAGLLDQPDTERMEIPVKQSGEAIRSAPPPETDPPVSEQARTGKPDLAAWPAFLVGTEIPYTPSLAMAQLGIGRKARREPVPKGAQGDPHLRSMAEVSGYGVAATDGEMGTVTDFLIDSERWEPRYFVVETGKWMPGRRVVISRGQIAAVDWTDGLIHVDGDREGVENALPLRSIEDLELSPSRFDRGQYAGLAYWPM